MRQSSFLCCAEFPECKHCLTGKMSYSHISLEKLEDLVDGTYLHFKYFCVRLVWIVTYYSIMCLTSRHFVGCLFRYSSTLGSELCCGSHSGAAKFVELRPASMKLNGELLRFLGSNAGSSPMASRYQIRRTEPLL